MLGDFRRSLSTVFVCCLIMSTVLGLWPESSASAAAAGGAADDIAAAASAEDFRFFVRTVRLDGVTVFRDGDLSPFVQGVIGRDATLLDLEHVADDITAFYRVNGFAFAYAFIPPQEIANGVVVITVEEGRYAAVTLHNESKLNDATAVKLLGPVQPGAIIEEQSLTWALRRLDGAAGVRATGGFKSTGDPGRAELVVTVEDGKLSTGSVSVDNYGDINTGEMRTSVSTEFNNVAGRGDRLGIQLSSSSGSFNGRLAYAWPSFMRGGQYYWSGAYTAVRYELGGPFAALQYKGSTDALQLMLQGPGRALGALGSGSAVVRPHRVNQFGYEYRQHNTSVFGVETPWDVHLFSAEQSEEWPLARLTGVDRFSARFTLGYLHSSDQDVVQQDEAVVRSAGLFAKLNVSMSWRMRLRARFGLHVAVDGQWASKNLHSSEKFSVGGPGGIRAYGVGAGSGDEGWLTRIELQREFDGSDRDGADRSSLRSGSVWTAFLFADAGGVRVNKKPWHPSEDVTRSLFGAGLGVNVDLPSGLGGRLEYAYPIRGGASGFPHDDDGRLWVRAAWRF